MVQASARAAHIAVALAALVQLACMPRGPVIDTNPPPANVGGTISGVVRAAAGSTPLSGRKVTAVEVDTGARHETSTAINGGYTMKLPPGRYRLEVELRANERLAESPDPVAIGASDMDAGRNFVIAVQPTGRAALTPGLAAVQVSLRSARALPL